MKLNDQKLSTQRTIVEDTFEIAQGVTRLPNKPLEIQWERFSSWTKLVHTICYILRWKPQSTYRTNFIGRVPESRTNDIQIGSKEAFSTEYVALTGVRVLFKIKHCSTLPFNDDNGIMRARGRLSKVDFEFDTKHPILLPSKHPKMQLVMLECHLRQLPSMC